MTISSVTPSHIRRALLLRDEIALLDLRHEAAFATGHPLFAANMAAARSALEAETRLPRPHYRPPISDQCRRRQQSGGAAQRHDRLDAGQTKSRARRRPARRDRP